jgi:hypothetical protein
MGVLFTGNREEKFAYQELIQRKFLTFENCSVKRHFNTAFSTGKRANVFLFFFNF